MLLDVLTEFVAELRAAGIPVSLVETIDAVDALHHTELTQRPAFKASLGATLVKNERHLVAFDTAFEVFFAGLRELELDGESDSDDESSSAAREKKGGQGRGSGGGGGQGLDALRDALADALRASDQQQMRELAEESVERFSGMEPGRPVGGTYYLYRTLRQLGFDEIRRDLLEEATGDDPLAERLEQEELGRSFEQFRSEVEAEIRRLLVADRGREAVAKTLRRPLIDDVDLMHATRDDLARMEDVIRPLTRRLAARLAQRRRHLRQGRLDFRSTVRRSLASGGVPLEPVFKKPHITKPEIILLCDISGSMATFARFTLQFVYSMNSHFSKLRSFAFIDALDEVTQYFGVGVKFGEALETVTNEAGVVHLDGHSDYGRSLNQFWERYGGIVTSRSTVIIAGDARNNYRPAQAETLAAIQRVARGVFWLNPEPKTYWDTGDSVMREYTPFCDAVFEVRTLRQLEEFVERVSAPAVGR